MKQSLVEALDRYVASGEFDNGANAKLKNGVIAELAECSEAWSSLALSQIDQYQHGVDRAVIDTTQGNLAPDSNLIVAEIRQSFAKHLGLEWFYFRDAKFTSRLHRRFPSKSRPIWITASSPNMRVSFSGRVPRVQSVVIFPEDWRYPTRKSAAQLNQSDVFFFIDRFVLRTEYYSWKLLESYISQSTFASLRDLVAREPEGLAEQLCSDWLGPHERNHRGGSIPFVLTETEDFRIFKSNRAAGAFEEMRADVNAILELHSNASEDGYEKCVAEFIALERLFRYPVQHLTEKRFFAPRKHVDYDSIGSQLLMRFLLNRQYVRFENGRIALSANYLDGFFDFAAEAEEVQKRALEAADATTGDERQKKHAGRDVISQYVRIAVGFDKTINDFRLDPIFYELASDLGSS